MKTREKVTIAKRSASSKGTADIGIRNKNLHKTPKKAKDDEIFIESIEEKLCKLRWNIQEKVRKFH